MKLSHKKVMQLYHQTHKAEELAYRKAYYLKNKKAILLAQHQRYLANPQKFGLIQQGYYQSHKEEVDKRARKYQALHRMNYRKYGNACRSRYKDKVFAHYGNRCACCGESEMKFLSIDHVNNDGADHRKQIRAGLIYAWLVHHNFPPEFQVLCRNCNWGKFVNGGVCPHKDKKEKK